MRPFGRSWASAALLLLAAACAEPSPDLTPGASDATEPASAAEDSQEQAVATDVAEGDGAADGDAETASTADADEAAAPAEPPAAEEADPSPPLPAATPAEFGDRRPYVVIRIADSSVDYERALAEAVKRAVARKPNVAFDLVAVTPRAGTAEDLADLTRQARAQAAAVEKSLADLGIGPERVNVMTWTGQPTDVNEIRLYIR